MESAAKAYRARRGTETRQRQRRVTYRITETEYAKVEAAASAAGLTLASYARSRTVAEPATRMRSRPSVDVLAVAKLLGAINKMGGNLHQIAKHMNFGGTPEAAEIRAALAGYEAMVAAVLAVLGKQP